MKANAHAVILLLAAFVALAAAWSKEDHEIFRLRDEVLAHEGANVTFYSFVGVAPGVTQDEFNKAYRKRSRNLHPDKAVRQWETEYATKHAKTQKGTKKGVKVGNGPSKRELEAYRKEASERFARLGLIASVLRGSGRERYDHFLRNGFPMWKGTGYYYARFRPGLGSVLIGLFIFGGGFAHYGALLLSWRRQRDFVERYVRHARRMAWGDEAGISGIPGVDSPATATPPPAPAPSDPDNEMDYPPQPLNRRQKRQQEKEDRKASKKPTPKRAAAAAAALSAKSSGISTPVEATLTSGPVGAKKRVVAENGKILIVDSVGNVYLEEESEEGGGKHEFLLDPAEIAKPTIWDTAVIQLPLWAYRTSVGRFVGGKQEGLVGEEAEEEKEKEKEKTVLTPTTSDEEEQERKLLERATSLNPNAEARKRNVKNRVGK